MTEHTGAHFLDTGDGPKPLTLASGAVLESKVQLAYRAYIEHRPGCEQCRAGDTLQCKAADALWDAYREVRA